MWPEYPFTRNALPKSLVELLEIRAQQNPQGVAYHWLADGLEIGPSGHHQGILSYSQLEQRAQAIAVYLLHELKLKTGDRVMLIYPPGIEFICGFFGCLYAGIIAVPAYPPRPNRAPDHLNGLARDAGVLAALTCESVWALIQNQLPANPELKNIQWARTDLEIPLESAHDSKLWKEPPIHTESLAFLQYTSGSTSSPKGVAVSHQNILQNEWMIQQFFNHNEHTRVLGWLPLYHDMGLIGNLLQPLYLGVPCYLMPSLVFLQRPLKWLESISKYRITTSGGPNFGYDLCIEAATKGLPENLDLTSWKLAFTGAEPVRASTLELFSEIFSEYGFSDTSFYPCYGLAETTLITSGGSCQKKTTPLYVSSTSLREGNIQVTPSDDSNSQRLISNGFPPLGTTLCIVNPANFQPLPENQVGEIWVKGPHVAQGYWGNSEKTEAQFGAYTSEGTGPFLRTGDLGFLHQNELYITGREKELIIIRGKNYYAQDIELSIEKCHPMIRPNGNAAFAIWEDGKEKLVVVSELERDQLKKPSEDISWEDLVGKVRRAVSQNHEVPLSAWYCMRPYGLPKTTSGKIKRNACRQELETGTLELAKPAYIF